MLTGWKHLTPVYFYSALVVCLIAFTRGEDFSWRKNFLLLTVGVFSWTLIEYGLPSSVVTRPMSPAASASRTAELETRKPCTS